MKIYERFFFDFFIGLFVLSIGVFLWLFFAMLTVSVFDDSYERHEIRTIQLISNLPLSDVDYNQYLIEQTMQCRSNSENIYSAVHSAEWGTGVLIGFPPITEEKIDMAARELFEICMKEYLSSDLSDDKGAHIREHLLEFEKG